MAYIIVITLASFFIAAGSFLSAGVYTLLAFVTILLTVWLGILAVVLIDGVFAFLVRRLPERWFSPANAFFSVTERERRLYRRLGIHRWKAYVPELGCFTGFHKDHLRDPFDRAYTARFLMESHYGVVGHIAGAVLGFSIMFLPFLPPLRIALPIAVINLILNLLPTMILRYNTPALLRLYRRNTAKAGAPKS